MPGTLFRFRKPNLRPAFSYLGSRSLTKLTGENIQSGLRVLIFSISGAMAIPIVGLPLYLLGRASILLSGTAIRSTFNLSNISTVAIDVAIILGFFILVTCLSSSCLFFVPSGCWLTHPPRRQATRHKASPIKRIFLFIACHPTWFTQNFPIF